MTKPLIPSTPPTADGHALELHEPKARAAHEAAREKHLTRTVAGAAADIDAVGKIIRDLAGLHRHDFDASQLDAARHFAPYFANEGRLKVRTTYRNGKEYVRTGTVGVTNGWKPSFMLIHRSSARSSYDILDGDDEIVAIWNGRRYEPVTR